MTSSEELESENSIMHVEEDEARGGDNTVSIKTVPDDLLFFCIQRSGDRIAGLPFSIHIKKCLNGQAEGKLQSKELSHYNLTLSKLKGNCNGIFLFAFLSGPRSISKCGEISKLLVKYPLCCGQSFYSTSCCGWGLFMMQIRERVHGGFYRNESRYATATFDLTLEVKGQLNF